MSSDKPSRSFDPNAAEFYPREQLKSQISDNASLSAHNKEEDQNVSEKVAETENKEVDEWDTYSEESVLVEELDKNCEKPADSLANFSSLNENTKFFENLQDHKLEDIVSKFGLPEPDKRPHLSVVFIGHVDAGKSTTCGNLLVLSGQIDQRSLEKYEREAKEKNRESWYYAFILDINEEERQRGKTVEVGRASLNLDKIRFTILDAPGHKGYVPNMISGAAQADVAVLIISARKGEFETGFERGGQTREHAMLAKTLGVSYLIVAVNKMDDPTCNWSEERYLDIQKRMNPFLKKCGYNLAKDITFVPISGLEGSNLKLHCTNICFKSHTLSSWYTSEKPTLFQILDNLVPPPRDKEAPLRIPLLEGFRDQGVMAIGKVEAGTVLPRFMAVLLPKKIKVYVLSVIINNEEVAYALPGENVTLKLGAVQEDQIMRGSVLCPIKHPCFVATSLKTQVVFVDLLEHRPIVTIGYACIIHIHTSFDECQIVALHESVDRNTKRKKANPQFVRSNCVVVCTIQLTNCVCCEPYELLPSLGRFTLRDEGKTIAVGKVLEVLTTV